MFDSIDEARGYVAALIDGEGSVSFVLREGKSPYRRVNISNTDPSIICAFENALDMLGVKHWIFHKRFKAQEHYLDSFRVEIRRQANFKRLYEQVTLRSDRKQAALEAIAGSFTHETHIGAGTSTYLDGILGNVLSQVKPTNPFRT
jgi:hypothetical protein